MRLVNIDEFGWQFEVGAANQCLHGSHNERLPGHARVLGADNAHILIKPELMPHAERLLQQLVAPHAEHHALALLPYYLAQTTGYNGLARSRRGDQQNLAMLR